MNIKKWILCLASCFLLVGCSQSKEEVQKTVEAYYEIVSEGDIEKANHMYAVKPLGLDEEFQNQLETVFQNDSEAFVRKVFSSMYKEIEIESIQVHGKQATVLVNVNGILPKDLDTIDEVALEQIESLVDAYLAENEGRMAVLMLKDPQEATQKMMDDLSQEVLDIYCRLIDKIESKTTTLTLQLEKVKDEWKIIDLQ